MSVALAVGVYTFWERTLKEHSEAFPLCSDTGASADEFSVRINNEREFAAPVAEDAICRFLPNTLYTEEIRS